MSRPAPFQPMRMSCGFSLMSTHYRQRLPLLKRGLKIDSLAHGDEFRSDPAAVTSSCNKRRAKVERQPPYRAAYRAAELEVCHRHINNASDRVGNQQRPACCLSLPVFSSSILHDPEILEVRQMKSVEVSSWGSPSASGQSPVADIDRKRRVRYMGACAFQPHFFSGARDFQRCTFFCHLPVAGRTPPPFI